MNLRRPQFVATALLAGAMLVLVLAPAIVGGGIRGWLWWAGRAEGLVVEVARVDAPLFRPVVLHGLRVRTQPSAPLAVDVALARTEVGLNLGAVFGRSTGRRLREVSVEGARVSIGNRVSPPDAHSQFDWTALQNLFADTLHVAHLDFRIEHGSTIVEGRDVAFGASEVQTGALTIAELAVASPLVSKRFTNLRGATSWQNQRLTLGAITLARGIDIDAMTADFSHIALQRIGLELNVDVFGGKVRAHVTTNHRAGRRFWDVAGTAANISLAQMAETLAWNAPAAGAVRTCKFTFRGDPAALMKSTASIWAEVNDLGWQGHKAETIMLGASLYNRRLHLEQLYVKQEKNQLTLSADTPLTFSGEERSNPELNVDVSASIRDLNALAQLFGARADEYAGEVELDGSIGVEERQILGGLTASGALQLNDARGISGSSLTARIVCSGSAATMHEVVLQRGDDHIAARGEVDFSDFGQIAASFFPTTPTTDLTAVPSGSCVTGLALSPRSAGSAATDDISEIEVRGGLFGREWSVAVVHDVGDVRTARTFRLCPASVPGSELRLAGAVRPP